MDTVINCITKKYFDFSSRAPRKEFWFFFLCYLGGIFILTFIDVLANTFDDEIGVGFFTSTFVLLTAIPYLAVAVRRLHDTDRTGWWVLIAIIPIIGGVCLIVLHSLKGNQGENRFGDDPLALQEKRLS